MIRTTKYALLAITITAMVGAVAITSNISSASGHSSNAHEDARNFYNTHHILLDEEEVTDRDLQEARDLIEELRKDVTELRGEVKFLNIDVLHMQKRLDAQHMKQHKDLFEEKYMSNYIPSRHGQQAWTDWLYEFQTGQKQEANDEAARIQGNIDNKTDKITAKIQEIGYKRAMIQLLTKMLNDDLYTPPPVEEETASSGSDDTTAPSVKLNGFNPTIVDRDSVWADEDPGATCTDDTDTDPTITSSGTVDTSDPSGTYFVWYTCTDDAGNTDKIRRTVYVRE